MKPITILVTLTLLFGNAFSQEPIFTSLEKGISLDEFNKLKLTAPLPKKRAQQKRTSFGVFNDRAPEQNRFLALKNMKPWSNIFVRFKDNMLFSYNLSSHEKENTSSARETLNALLDFFGSDIQIATRTIFNKKSYIFSWKNSSPTLSFIYSPSQKGICHFQLKYNPPLINNNKSKPLDMTNPKHLAVLHNELGHSGVIARNNTHSRIRTRLHAIQRTPTIHPLCSRFGRFREGRTGGCCIQ